MKLWLVIFAIFSFNVYGEIVNTLGPQKAVDVSHDFFVTLLEKSIVFGAKGIELPIEVRTKPYSGQGRVLELLGKDKYYDIVWTANTKERNLSLLPVPFPLFRGGLGLRGFVIRKQDQDYFSRVFDVEDLKKTVLCQGRHWPDSDILKEAGLLVEEITHFDAMLAMVSMGRCDAVTLSVFEGAAELQALESDFPDLVFFTEVVLQYDLVMNFYVNKDNKILAERVYRGLTEMNETGEFDRLLESHALTKDVISAWNSKIHRVIHISNQNRADIQSQLEYFWPMVSTSR